MKTFLNRILLPAILLATATGCSDDFLDKNPPQEIAAGQFWTSEGDVQMGLAGCYARLKGTYVTWHRSYWDAAADNGWAQHYGDIRLMQSGTLDPANSGAPRSLYTSCYQGIAGVNIFLQNFSKVALPDAAAKAYEAEARFLRALFYFELVQRWGGVVIYREVPADIEQLKIAKSTKEDVYKFIEEDLNFAVANLPDDAYKSGLASNTSARA